MIAQMFIGWNCPLCYIKYHPYFAGMEIGMI